MQGTNVVLYGTTGSSTNGGEIYSFTDSTGFAGTITGSATGIAAAATNEAFRGIAFAPGSTSISVTSGDMVYNGTPYVPAISEAGSANTVSYTYYLGNAATGTPLASAPSVAGQYTVVASVASDGIYNAASSNPLTFNITPATPTVTVSDAGGEFTGSPFPATALVNGAATLEGVTPTLAYYVGTSATGTSTSTAPSMVGTYTAVANFAGSTNYATTSSAPVTFTIAADSATVTIPQGITATAGQTAKVNLPVTVTGLDTTTGLLSADFVITYDPTKLSIASNGVQLGSDLVDNDWSVTKNLNTAGIIRVSLFSSDQPPIQTSPEQLLNLAFTALNGPSGTSVIGFSTAPGDVNDLNEGTFALTANNGSVVITGDQTIPTVTVSDAGGAFTGSQFPATALVNSAASLEGVTPTLAYYIGTTATGTSTSTAPSTVGTYTVVANFAGSTDFTAASSAPVTFSITQATPTVTVSDAGGTFNGTSSFPATALVNGAASLEGVTPTLAYYVGTTATGTSTSTAPTTAGTYTVVANFAGSTSYVAASSAPLTFIVAQATPTVTVSDAGGAFTGNPFPATALVNGAASLEGVTPTFAYYVGTTAMGTSTSTAPSAAGTYTVVANFAGSTNYAAASSSPVTFTISAVQPINPFTPGDIVVLRVGAAGAGSSLADTGTAVFLDEYTPACSLVQSIPMPTASTVGGNQSLVLGNSSNEGELNLSTDGLSLLLAGYDTAPGTGGTIENSTSSAIPRTIGMVGADGTVNTTTALTDLLERRPAWGCQPGARPGTG